MLNLPARWTCACALLWAAGGALAADGPTASPFLATAWQAVEDDVLDQMRGGFELSSVGSGLAVSFGFVRSVMINGDLVSHTRFSLPDLGHISADQAKLASDALAQAQVVQNGLGNSVGVNNLPVNLGATTVVQNSLSNQNIQTLTQIDAGVNSLGLLRSLNLQGVLQDALVGALRVR